METEEKLKNAIEDLYFVSDLDIHPFLGQINFYVSQLRKEKSSPKSIQIDDFPFLAKFMDTSFRSLIENYTQRSIYLKTCKVSPSFKNFDLLKAESLLAQLPLMLKIISLMKLGGDLIVDLNDRFLVISALLKKGKGIRDNKIEILEQVKSLFAVKTLTTFNIRESEVIDCAILDLKFDIGYNEDLTYQVQTSDLIGVDLCMPNQLKNYEISKEEFSKINEHQVFKINENCKIERVKDYTQLNGQVIHFHFLFRPISFIIPKRGDLIDIKSLGRKDTGSDWTTKTVPTYFIDIFSSH
ncbi:MAG: hypothetical protein OEY33_02385 [Bdellovibrionales bacterium]|nr:hypothetical protein [Bdellovibrionales bacterium]